MIKRFFLYVVILALLAAAIGGAGAYWAHRPLLSQGQAPVEFAVEPGSSVRSSARQIAAAGVPLNPTLFAMLARITGKAARLKAGHYELKPGTTPLALVEQLVRGEFAQESLTIVEGWTFRQMRAAIDAHPNVRHDTSGMSDSQLLAQITGEYTKAEGLFFPDTYLFAKGASDLQIYRQAHAMMMKQLSTAWEKRSAGLPYKSPYEALIMASIIEKETGQREERSMIAAVFVNRLRKGMLLQTDPTVIYGLGEKFDGNIRKQDLLTDTEYNSYTRAGLPPTPIALPGAESLTAALNPAQSDVLYFVARGNGTSEFSRNLEDHNRAVNKYQR